MNRVIAFFSILIVGIYPKYSFAQVGKPNSYVLSKKTLIGTWQAKSKMISNNFRQNIRFASDGSFVMNIGSDDDDARYLVQLKGKYRVDNCNIYFTIISRTNSEGDIEVADPGEYSSIFTIRSGKLKQVMEKNPHEMLTPCRIDPINQNQIKLNNKPYFRIKESDASIYY